MEAFWTQIVTFLIQGGGGFGVAAAAEGLIIWRLFDLLMKSHDARLADKDAATKAAEATTKAAAALADELRRGMTERAAELERLTSLLQKQRGRP